MIGVSNPIQAGIIQSLSAGSLGTTQNIKGGEKFGNLLTKMLEKTSASQASSSDMQERIQLDDPSVSIEQSMIASNEASLNFEFTLQTRNKLMKAYQELMSMPV